MNNRSILKSIQNSQLFINCLVTDPPTKIKKPSFNKKPSKSLQPYPVNYNKRRKIVKKIYKQVIP
jgi:hypothetical protein